MAVGAMMGLGAITPVGAVVPVMAVTPITPVTPVGAVTAGTAVWDFAILKIFGVDVTIGIIGQETSARYVLARFVHFYAIG